MFKIYLRAIVLAFTDLNQRFSNIKINKFMITMVAFIRQTLGYFNFFIYFLHVFVYTIKMIGSINNNDNNSNIQPMKEIKLEKNFFQQKIKIAPPTQLGHY